MSAKAALVVIAVALPSGIAAEQPDNTHHQPPLERAVDDTLIWHPNAGGLRRIEMILPPLGVSHAIAYNDTSSLFYLGQRREAPITWAPMSGPTLRLESSGNRQDLGLDWTVSDVLAVGVGVTKEGDHPSGAYVQGATVIAPDTTQLTVAGVQLGDTSILSLERSTLTLDERSESLMHASISSDNTSKVSASYGQRYWDVWSGVDLAWAAGLESETPFASLQLETGRERLRSSLRATWAEDTGLEIGLHVTLEVDGGRYGRVQASASTVSRAQTALNVTSLRTQRRAYLSTLWQRDITVEALRQRQAQNSP